MSCVAMCFTASSTSDDRSSSLTDGARAKLLQLSGPKRNKPQKLPRSRLSTAYASVKNPEAVAKVDALTTQNALAAKNAYSRLALSANANSMQRREALVTKSISPSAGRGVEQSAHANSMPRRESVVTKSISPSTGRGVVQTELIMGGTENPAKPDRSVIISAQFVAKLKTKQMKGMITGMGKELKRAASTVTEKIPNSTKKKNKEEKERLDLLAIEPQTPQARHPDQIKKAYGHPTNDTRQAANMAHDKLRERGEKLSAIQRRTADLEADAANFSSLADELVKKMESKKWYEM